MIQITVENQLREYEDNITYESIVEEFQPKYEHTISLVVADGKIQELSKKARQGQVLQMITVKDSIGHKAYARTAIMILLKALGDILGNQVWNQVKVEFAIGQGYYCAYENYEDINETLVHALNERMEQLIHQNIAIEKRAYTIDEAVTIFQKQGMEDKVNLFKYRHSSYVNVYQLDGFCDYFYGYMMPSTGYIKKFSVISKEKGFMLLIPSKEIPNVLGEFEHRKKLFDTLYQANEWNHDMGINNVGDLNNHICEAKVSELILVQEALQERRIGEIAREIVSKEGVKFVMIAGPSSSGKTTFSHRLSVQLRTLGMTPHPIAVDDYFVERDDTPLDENGNYNFECLDAIDLELFNRQMSDLMAGKTVELPTFNFKTGHKEYRGNYKTLGPHDILVIEGIHGLNDKMSYTLPNESKYKIYISALTSLNVDGHNRIPTTDGRLLRRMVRDARVRGVSAKRTISMWPSVRRGEEENIFPYQETADVMFNSALIYELAVLKIYAEPLLYSIPKGEPEYFEAKRLLKFLSYFLAVDSANLPNNSIVREFVGGSCF